jgi:hypothetical protein
MEKKSQKESNEKYKKIKITHSNSQTHTPEIV